MMPSTTEQIVAKPRLLFRPNAVLGWSLTPNFGVKVLYRDNVIQHIGPDGWRVCPNNEHRRNTRVAVYGCSYVYGTGLADEETFVALLQASIREAQFSNRGIGGQGTVQNFLQFRSDVASHTVDAAIFGIFSDHRFRNIAHPKRMRQLQHSEWYRLGVEHVPLVRLGRQETYNIEYVPIWQPAMQYADFEAFLPDEAMIDAATVFMLREIVRLARQHAIPVCFALLDQLDPGFNEMVLDLMDDVFDVSVPWDERHTFLPRDLHPNPVANQHFAEGLLEPVRDLVDRARKVGA